jgi:poly-gamma-glutamate system protein
VRWLYPKVRLSRLALAAVAAAGVAWGVNAWQAQARDAARHRAAETMATAIERIREERIRRGIGFSADDMERTGLVGEEMSPLVTTLGSLSAKRAATDTAFAALVVDLFRRVGVREGDVVAVGFSGSLPGLNLAVLSAASALRLQPLVISSVGTSQWGATDPAFTWLDIEQMLHATRVFPYRSVAASRGGGVGENFLLEEGRQYAEEVIRRNGIRDLQAASLSEAVRLHLAVYREATRGRPVAAFVNVGGSSVNVGRCDSSRIPPGLVSRLPACEDRLQGLAHHFARLGVPVIHLLQVQRLARRYGVSVKAR